MKKILTYITYTLGLVVALFVTGCSDAPEEITEVDYDRLFSVHENNMTVNVINRTTLRLTWSEVNGAEAYVIELFAGDENMNFEGTASRTVETEYQSPLLIEGLQGETTYSGRIKAIASDIADSKWVEFSFKTDAENIFNSLSSETLGATFVTLSWSPEIGGTDLSTITLIATESNQSIIHTITSSEMVAGEVTIDGLTGFTTYTATMLSEDGTRERGLLTFTTNYDGISVAPGESIKDAITGASDGDIIALLPGEHEVNTSIDIDKSISLISATTTGEKPVIYGISFNLLNSSHITINNLVLNGNGDGRLFLIPDSEIRFGDITLEGCELTNYTSQIIYNNYASSVNSITIDDCMVYNMDGTGGDMIDFRNGPCYTITVTNSTFANIPGGRDFIRMDNNNSATLGNGGTTVIENCTFYKCFSGGTDFTSGYGILYLRYSGNSVRFTKNIIANTSATFARNENTNVINATNNNIFETKYITTAQLPGSLELDPEFVDPDNNNLSVRNETLFYGGYGDPRWTVSLEDND